MSPIVATSPARPPVETAASLPPPADGMTPAQSRRREQILHAAGRQFARLRYDEVLMEDVAREAQVGKGTIYRYFADKEELYTAVVGEGFDRLLQQLRCADGERDPVVRLERVVAAIVGFLHRDRSALRLTGRDEDGSPRRSCQERRRRRAQLAEAVSGVLQQGAEAGLFDVRHPRADAHILLGIVRACLRFDGESLTPSQVTDETLRVFLRGVARDPHPSIDPGETK
jgi:AcrR family transcriptional regulator